MGYINLEIGKVKEEYKNYSLTHLVLQCIDFIEEKSDLEELCHDVSLYILKINSVLYTPKFHCELAGEGIGYSSGALKRMYRRQPISMKISTTNFEPLVKLSVDGVLKEMV